MEAAIARLGKALAEKNTNAGQDQQKEIEMLRSVHREAEERLEAVIQTLTQALEERE